MDWTRLAEDNVVDATAKALEERNFKVIIAENGAEARKRLLELIPNGSEVMEVSSTTLDEIGVTKEMDESGNYISLRKEIRSTDDPQKRQELRRKTASPEYVIGSAHAVTQKGQLVVASATGSQIAPYSYGASKVILVIGTQKIVKDLDEAFDRIYNYVLGRESERVRKAYGMPKSSVNKLFIYEREAEAGRVKIILVKEALGF